LQRSSNRWRKQHGGQVIWALLAAAVVFLAASGGHAAPDPAQQENERLDAIEALYHQGRWREGYLEAEPGTFRTAEGQVAARYLRALGLMRLGRSDLAVPQLRAILADHPRLERVRLTLAAALRETGDEEGARHHFELLLGSRLDPELDRQIRSSLAALDEGRRWSLSAHFAHAPSTNINLGTDRDAVDIGGIIFEPAPGSKQQSGIGAQYGLNGGYRLPIADNWSATAGGAISRKDYRGSQFDETTVEVSLGLLNRTRVGYWGVEVVGSQEWATGAGGRHNPAMSALGGRAYGRFVPSSAWRLDLTAQAMARDYRHADSLDGYRADMQVSADRFIDSRSFVRLLTAGIYEKAGRDDLTFHDATLGAGLFREWRWGISTYVQASVAGRWHHGDFAFAGEPRRDVRTNALLRVTKRDFTILDFAPYWQVGYTINNSNIDLHDYRKLDVNLGWTRTF
jgi:hypothetical protein